MKISLHVRLLELRKALHVKIQDTLKGQMMGQRMRWCELDNNLYVKRKEGGER